MWSDLAAVAARGGVFEHQTVEEQIRVAITEANAALAAQTRRTHQELVRHTVAQALGIVRFPLPGREEQHG